MLDKIHTTLVQQAPKFLKVPAHLVPDSVQQTLMLQTLKHVFREALDDGDFAFLEGRWLEVHVLDLDLHHYISYANDALVMSDKPESVDVTFKGNLNDLILIAARKEDADTLFFQRRLLIEGDTELGLALKNLIDSVDLEAIPSVPRKALLHLADFIQKGLQKPQASIEGDHAA